jgi:hypothetical protein
MFALSTLFLKSSETSLRADLRNRLVGKAAMGRLAPRASRIRRMPVCKNHCSTLCKRRKLLG